MTRTADEEAQDTYLKSPGDEPLPGYVLIQPLGKGGFGEVWKCEAPGGLLKAIKFVGGDPEAGPRGGSQLKQEYEAFEQVKAIRHPFLLCLERVELVDDELIMVMGLADRHIGERFHDCRAAGLPGIPRDELLGYLREAAEALDVIGEQYGLQHLDVKPANLFLTAGHLQVGDYGLVSKLDGGTESRRNRGLTPKYAAPEVLRGRVDTRSDQYSLALVYQEMLTGTFPFPAKTSQQMMFQHATAVPDLSGLAEPERRPVAKALAKAPADRYPTCRDFIAALGRVLIGTPRLSTVTTVQQRPASGVVAAAPRAGGSSSITAPTRGPAWPGEATHRSGTVRLSGVVPPPLVGVNKSRLMTPADLAALAGTETDDDCVALTATAPAGVQLAKVLSVVPVGVLLGRPTAAADLAPDDVIRAVLAAAGGEQQEEPDAAEMTRHADGSWSCRFLTTVDHRLAKVKLDLIREAGEMTLDASDPRQLVLQRLAPASRLFGFGKRPPSGLEIAVALPSAGGTASEAAVVGRVFGSPPAEFLKDAEDTIRAAIEAVRRQLHNVNERRKHPRIRADFPLTLYPLHSDARLDPPVSGRCVDVSAGGIAFLTADSPQTRHVYVSFDGVRETAGLAVLVQLIGRRKREDGVLVQGSFRGDLWPG